MLIMEAHQSERSIHHHLEEFDHNELFGSDVKHVQLKRLEPLLIELENLGVFLYSDKIFGDCLRIFPARIQCRLYFYATKFSIYIGD